MHFLGIDIGTSAVKAVLVNEAQAVVAQASAPIATRQPRPGWSEQEPEDWWRATERVVGHLYNEATAAFLDTRAIGLSGQMHGAVILDAGGLPVRPAMVWNDGRAVAECAVLTDAVPGLAEIAGVIAMPGFTAPKLMWLRTHEPENFARIRRVVLAKDFVRLRLTGEIATDTCDAAGTLILDEARRDWSDAILAAVGVAREQMPRLLEGNAVSGLLRPGIAASWGLRHPVVVAAGGGDSAAGAVGIGAIDDGDSFLSLGTSAQIFVTRDRYEPKPATLIHAFAHVLPGSMVRAGRRCSTARRSRLDRAGRRRGCRDVAGASGGAVRGAGERDVPAVSRRRADAAQTIRMRAARLPGWSNATSPLDLVQAVLDGVALSLADGQQAFGNAALSPLPMIGGGARSRFWMRLISAAMGRPLLRVSGGDNGPAFGAARLARMAVSGETPEAVCTKPAWRR
ncbi:MAG: FGGY family carbohydrate kinase [Bauldia sp.]